VGEDTMKSGREPTIDLALSSIARLLNYDVVGYAFAPPTYGTPLELVVFETIADVCRGDRPVARPN